MRLRVRRYSETVIQLERLDGMGQVASVRPATAEEQWMYNRMEELEKKADQLDQENASLRKRIEELEAMWGQEVNPR